MNELVRCGQFPKCGIHRTRFLLESIKDLRQALQKLGSDLVVRTGPPEDIIPEIAGIVNAAAVYTQEEVCIVFIFYLLICD